MSECNCCKEKDIKINILEERIKLLECSSLKDEPTIRLNSYRDPSLDHLTEDNYTRAMKKMARSVPEIITHIYFNENIPQNHNVCITNFYSKFAKVFDGKEWRTVNQEKLINDLIDDSEYLLECYADNHPELKQYIDRYHDIKGKYGPDVEKEIKLEVKTLLYDKRNMVKYRIRYH